VDGLLYVASSKGQVLALDPSTGSTRWSASAPDAVVGFTVWRDTLLPASIAPFRPSRALETKTGVERWALRVGDGMGSPLMLVGDVGLFLDREGSVFRVDLGTGAEVHHDMGTGAMRLGLGHGLAVIGDQSGKLTALE
jgi:outer membrane protein assembly factor BamB